MKIERITIDLMEIVTLATAILLGITGRVDWWIVLLVFLSQIHLPICFYPDGK